MGGLVRPLAGGVPVRDLWGQCLDVRIFAGLSETHQMAVSTPLERGDVGLGLLAPAAYSADTCLHVFIAIHPVP